MELLKRDQRFPCGIVEQNTDVSRRPRYGVGCFLLTCAIDVRCAEMERNIVCLVKISFDGRSLRDYDEFVFLFEY